MTFMLRRKKYFVERNLQLRFARFVILFVFISAILTGLTVYYTTFMMLGERLAQIVPQARLAIIFRSVHIAFLINLLIILPIIFYISILFSHRIAGPLPKITEALRTIGSGDFSVRIVLREQDELKDLAEAINHMAIRLQEKDSKINPNR